MNKTIFAVACAVFAGTVNATPVLTSGSFVMYQNAGYDTSGIIPGGLLVSTDSTITGFVDQVAGTWGVASTTLFFGYAWTASGGNLIQSAGTYNMDSGAGVVTPVGSCAVAYDGNICFSVGANQIAGTINFAWSGIGNIRMVEVWNINPGGSLTATVAPAMENGPLPGFNAAFNLASSPFVPVPLPAALWLLGPGLMSLAGLVRRKRGALARTRALPELFAFVAVRKPFTGQRGIGAFNFESANTGKAGHLTTNIKWRKQI